MIYFDNAATSWPKPREVRAALEDSFGAAGGNPGRSGHRMSIAAGRIVEDARESVAGLFNAADPSRLVLTANATHALNLAIHGLLRPGDHAVTTSLEHNSVMRPLRHLEKMGIELTVIGCAQDGTLEISDVARAFRSNTRLLVSAHASNVLGTILPLGKLAAVARDHGVLYLVDASQTAGTVPIDVMQLGVDLLAFTGHKGLMGPTGTGGLYVREGIDLTPLVRGGTGSNSAAETQPEFMPDALESGTPNVAGLAGLAAGVKFITRLGAETIANHERELAAHFLHHASEIAGVTLYGVPGAANRAAIISFNIAEATPSEVCVTLDESFGIMARPGLHCSPAAHRTMGTFPVGTVRFSFGWYNTLAEINEALHALRQIARLACDGSK